MQHSRLSYGEIFSLLTVGSKHDLYQLLLYALKNNQNMQFRSPSPLRRSSSNKKIVLTAPSQEVIRFLNLPNASGCNQTKQRLHILTPKTRSRASSIDSDEKTSNRKGSLSRISFLRKQKRQAQWRPTETQLSKTRLKLDDKRGGIRKCGTRDNLLMTFGHGDWRSIMA